MSWVMSVFESEDGGIPVAIPDRATCSRASGRASKKPRLVKEKAWVDNYEPTCKDHLAVHVKKIQEVESWLTAAVNGNMTGPIAVLVGPSGSGKTVTLQVVAKSMECRVKEWINPSNYRTDGFGTSSQEFVGSTNQVEQFDDFLFRASRYEDLFSAKAKHTLLMVEDIPNIYLHDSSLLEKTLRKYVEVGRCPLVFIFASGSSQNIEKLFRLIQVELEIKMISFNPVNKTLMCKALERILKAARKDQSISDTEHMSIEDAVDVANGDIRFAVNHLQYILLGERAPVVCCAPPELILPKNVGKGAPKSELSKSMRDKAADIFRCLGGVLYNKQTRVTDKKTGAASQRPSHDPEEISSKMSSVPHLFHGLLCENYPSVMSNVNYISCASEVLSQTDVMLNKHTEGTEKDMHKTYSINVSVHGLMNLPPSEVARKFLPFKGARIKEVIISARLRWKKCHDLFPTSHLPPQTLLTEVCPFLVKMDMGAVASDQRKYIHEVSQLMSMRRTSLNYVIDEDLPTPDECFREIIVVDVPTGPEDIKIQHTPEDEFIDIEECISSDESDNGELNDFSRNDVLG